MQSLPIQSSKLFVLIGCASVLLAILTALFLIQVGIVINHDAAYYLFAAQKVLAGGTYPEAVYDINPPLVILLSIPPVILAQFASISLPLALDLYVYFLIFLSLLLVWRAAPFERGEGVSGAPVAFVLLAIFEAGLPGYDFGQREHLICILVAPYACLVARRWSDDHPSRGLSISCAAFAVFGLYLKPTFLALPLMVLCIDIWRSRSAKTFVSPENVTFVIGGIVYFSLICIFFPGWFAIALDGVETYGNYAGRLDRIALSAFTVALPGAFCFALVNLFTSSRALQHAVWIAGLALVTSVFSLVAQNKGWSYHYVPVKFSLGMLYGLTALLALERLWQADRRYLGVFFLLFCSGTAATALVVQDLYAARRDQNIADLKALPLFELLLKADGEYVMPISTSGGMTSTPMHAGAKWGTRFIALLDLPFVSENLKKLPSLPPVQAARVLRLDHFLKSAVTEDIRLYRPQFILVDVGASMQGVRDGSTIDLAAYFMQDQAFAAQWTHYAPYLNGKGADGIMRIGEHPYRVYQRLN